MAFNWFSSGLLGDFDSIGSATQDNTLARSRTSGYSVYNSSTGYLRKNVTAGGEYWAATYIYPYMLSGNTNALKFRGGTTDLVYITIQSDGTVKAYRDSAVLLGSATAKYTAGNGRHIEVRVKRDGTNGICQVWIDGSLEIDVAGNTGSAANIDNIEFQGYGAGTQLNFSDLVIQDTGRIGDWRVALLAPNAAGDSSDWDSEDVIGYAPGDYNASSYAAYTYIGSSGAKAAGTVNKIEAYVNAGGNGEFALFRSTGAANTFSTAAASPTGTKSLAVGLNTFIAGTDFTAFDLQAGDYPGVQLDSTAKLELASSAAEQYWWLSGDRIPCTALSFGTPVSGGLALRYTYAVTNKSDAFQSIKEKGSANDAGFAWTNTDAALALFQLEDLPASGIGSIKGVQLVAKAKAEGSSAVTKLSLPVKGASQDDGSQVTLSAAYQYVRRNMLTNPLTANPWTKSEVNALQAGIKAGA